jgi:hypothetical protein
MSFEKRQKQTTARKQTAVVCFKAGELTYTSLGRTAINTAL